MLLVLRHAESAWNAPPKRCQGQLDVPLSEAGRAAALARGAELDLPDRAYASHLGRAVETAELLLEAAARRHGRPAPAVERDPRLAEAFCGLWQGELHEDLRRRWPDAWAALAAEEPAFAFPEGERLADVGARFAEALEELDLRHRDGNALVVTHGGPMRLFLAARLGRRSLTPGGPPRNLEGFVLDGGAIRLTPEAMTSRPAT